MTTDLPPEPKKVKWWKLAVRPRADLFTGTIVSIGFAVETGAGMDSPPLPTWTRIPLAILYLICAAIMARRAWRMPPDPPIQIIG
jgi:hypothetical protein